MDFTGLVTAFSDHSTAAIAALSILANAYQYREARADQAKMLELAASSAVLADQLAKAVTAAETIITHTKG